MSQALVSRNIVPYGGGFEIKDKLTGAPISGYTFDVLVEFAKNQRHANGVPIGLDFEKELEQWVCEAYPKECEHYNPRIPRRPNEVGFTDLLHGTRVMLAHVVNHREVVPREEAERRASICVNCRYNQPFRRPCGGICGELLDLVKGITNSQGTPMDEKLKSCFVCKCFLQASIWLPLEIQCKGVDAEQKAQFDSVRDSGIPCWKACI
jgi:hypothetical protein